MNFDKNANDKLGKHDLKNDKDNLDDLKKMGFISILLRFCDPQKPWLIVPSGSAMGFFNFVSNKIKAIICIWIPTNQVIDAKNS